MNLRAVAPAAVRSVEAIPLREEVLERSRPRSSALADSAVRAAECRPLVPHRLVVDPASATLQRDARREVGKLVCTPRDLDRDLARRVETEEPDSRLFVACHVRAYVELAQARHVRERQHPSGA